MNILINLQSFDDNDVYEEIIKLSCNNKINFIFLSSSLMHSLDEELYCLYTSINKVTILKTNNLFELSNMNNNIFDLSKEYLETEKYLYTDILSSYRWLPISKRKDNDFLSFSMVFYYDVYNYWNTFFKKNMIHFVIQLNEEHSSLDSILIRVAKEYKIKNIITSRIVGAFTSGTEEYHALYDNNSNEYMKIIKTSSDVGVKLNENSNFTVFSNSYKKNLSSKISLIFNKFYSTLFDNKLVVKVKIKRLYTALLNKIITSIQLRKQYFYIKELNQYYHKLAIDKVNLNLNYIYYCLHFDPEASTLPKDNAHANQLLNLRILASSLPKGWKIYIKEHPHQLSYNIYYDYLLNQLHSVDNFRSKNFYNYMHSISNVDLVGLDNNHQSLIQNAKFIVSNTGTVFREATYLKKHCITFSQNSFYAMLKNVNVVNNVDTCREVIDTYKDTKVEDIEVDEIFDEYAITINKINKVSSIILRYISQSVLK